jgi:hypothetical protein
MKLKSISASVDDEGNALVGVSVIVGKLDIVSAIASVAALFSGNAGTAAVNPTPAPAAPATAPAADTTESTGRRRRASPGAAEAPAATEAAPATEVAGESVTRRRRAAPAAAEPEVKTISDAELSKAASSAAAAIVAAGFDGRDAVMQVLSDFGVDTTNAIPQDKREEFLKVLQAEIDAAEADAAEEVATRTGG